MVNAWLGNSRDVARRHYLQVADHHFDRATGKSAANTLQKVSAGTRNGPQPEHAESLNAGVCDLTQILSTRILAEGGLEPPWEFPPGGF